MILFLSFARGTPYKATSYRQQQSEVSPQFAFQHQQEQRHFANCFKTCGGATSLINILASCAYTIHPPQYFPLFCAGTSTDDTVKGTRVPGILAGRGARVSQTIAIARLQELRHAHLAGV
jgi:hypothetical protein